MSNRGKLIVTETKIKNCIKQLSLLVSQTNHLPSKCLRSNSASTTHAAHVNGHASVTHPPLTTGRGAASAARKYPTMPITHSCFDAAIQPVFLVCLAPMLGEARHYYRVQPADPMWPLISYSRPDYPMEQQWSTTHRARAPAVILSGASTLSSI